MKLTAEAVRNIEHRAIRGLCLPDVPEEMAVQTLAYIEGLNTMAELIIDAIQELNGKKAAQTY